MNINNSALRLKREVMIHFVRLFDSGKLPDKIHTISKTMVPQGQESKSCCIYHDRAIIEQQIQNLMGMKLGTIDQELDLRDLYQELLTHSHPSNNSKSFQLNLLPSACHSCQPERHIITNACRGCLARPCQSNCPKDAIYFENHRAVIDQSKCINCGRCINECSYHAISYIPVPCKAACPVKAIEKDTDGSMKIDKEKCIACGKCMSECPFGAIMPRSQLLQLLTWMKEGKEVVAAIAPAIYGQFNSDKAQLVSALKTLGFTHIAAVASGADLTIKHEAHELQEKILSQHGPLTSSCCPAYVLLAKKHIPELAALVSQTPTPMHYTAEQIKQKWPGSKCVFIGPCIGKIAEAENDELVDAVLNFEELGALFVARQIEILNQPSMQNDVLQASQDAENFANSGGVGAAVINHLKKLNPDIVVRTRTIDGLDKKNIALLKSYTKDQSQWDFTEVMSCSGGCVGGNCTITSAKTAALRLKKIIEKKTTG